jgi:Tfp pilus assembly protein PilO
MTGADLIALIKKQPIGTACLAICLACGVVWYFRSDALENTRQEFEARAKDDQRIANDIRNGTGLPQQVETMQAAAKQLDTRLVHATQLASNLQYFYRLESETGVKLLDVRQLPLASLKPGAAKTLYTPVPFVISLQGGYKQIMDFTGRLEKGPRFCHFNSFSITKSISQEGASQLTASLNLDLLGTP